MSRFPSLPSRALVLGIAITLLGGCSCSKKEKEQTPPPAQPPPPQTIEPTPPPPPPQLGDAPRLPPAPAEKTESDAQAK